MIPSLKVGQVLLSRGLEILWARSRAVHHLFPSEMLLLIFQITYLWEAEVDGRGLVPLCRVLQLLLHGIISIFEVLLVLIVLSVAFLDVKSLLPLFLLCGFHDHAINFIFLLVIKSLLYTDVSIG